MISFMPVDRSYFLADLRASVVEVHFIKEDGSNRVMRATLHRSYVPLESLTENNQVPQDPNSKAVRVWDVELKDWRSIRLDRIVSMQLVNSI